MHQDVETMPHRLLWHAMSFSIRLDRRRRRHERRHRILARLMKAEVCQELSDWCHEAHFCRQPLA
jgi:hypothetical protein